MNKTMGVNSLIRVVKGNVLPLLRPSAGGEGAMVNDQVGRCDSVSKEGSL